MKKIFLALFLSLSLASCAQRDVTPSADPTVTTNDEVHGSMTATVNGREWVAGGVPDQSGLENVTAEVDPKTGFVTVSGRKYVYHAVKAEDLEEIKFTVKHLEEGSFRLGPSFDSLQTGAYYKGLGSPEEYYMHEKQTGTVSITRVDSAEHRLFGSFSFTVRNNRGDLVAITSGSFDNVRYFEPTGTLATETVTGQTETATGQKEN